MKPLAVYIHIPFCAKKCDYCDFLSFDDSADKTDIYVEALCREIIESKKTCESHVTETIYFGGGTPSILSSAQFKRIFEAVNKNLRIAESAEITVELNPESVTSEKLLTLLNLGVNRLSIGAQSFNDDLLKKLGRVHDFKTFADAFMLARKTGFTNISMDLMFGLENQSVEDFENTLKMATAMSPQHISCYSLTLEPATRLAKRNPVLPDDETDRKMYHMAIDILEKHGFAHYEISNFSKPGFESRHNQTYWTMKEYLAFGLGASSFFGGVRFKNTDDLSEYLSGDYSHREVMILSDKDKYSEFMFLGLRLNKGVNSTQFEKSFGVSMNNLFGKKLRELHSQGLISFDGDTAKLTAKGRDLSNIVFSELLLE